MSGQLLDHTCGRIDVRFRHTRHFLQMMMRTRGASTTVEPVDEDMEPAGPAFVIRSPAARFSMRISDVFCPFRSMLAWLEAIAAGVEECAFEIEAEGPVGRLAWQHSHLELTWLAHDRTTGVRLHADPRQVTRSFYTAFRRFVESPEYMPFEYENLRNGEAMVHRAGGVYTEAELVGQLLPVPRPQAEARLQAIWPLRNLGDSDWETRQWIDAGWDRWSVSRRRDYLREIFDMRGHYQSGGPLRTMRSTLIERWLSED